MTPTQEKLLKQIEAIKADPKGDRSALPGLVRKLVAEDDYVPHSRATDDRPGGGRSAGFGKWKLGEDYTE